MPGVFYLASFPRAGNTWLRFLIANVYNTVKPRYSEVDFFNIHEIVPELRAGKSGSPSEAALPSGPPGFEEFPLVIKTHAPFREAFTHVILLVRNPYDCLCSYRDYLNGNKGIAISLAETVRHDQYGIAALVRHAESYIRGCPNLLILTYENLRRQAGKELHKVFQFIDFAVDDRIVKAAVRRSSFAAMGRIEKSKGRKFGRPDFTFVRRGVVGEGEKAMRKDRELSQFASAEMAKSPLLFLMYG